MSFDTYNEMLNDTIDGLKREDIQKLSGLIEETRNNGKHLFVPGNSENVATASHWVYDFGREINRGGSKRLGIFSPTDNGAVFSTLGNDCGYETTLVEQMKNPLGPGDLVLIFSVSESSSNPVEIHRYAREIGIKTACVVTDKGDKIIGMSDFTMIILSESYDVVGGIHIILGHAILQQTHADNVRA